MRRAKDANTGRDATHYSRFHPKNYLSHHLAAIVCNAFMYDTDHIEHQIVALQAARQQDQAAAAAPPRLRLSRRARPPVLMAHSVSPVTLRSGRAPCIRSW